MPRGDGQSITGSCNPVRGRHDIGCSYCACGGDASAALLRADLSGFRQFGLQAVRASGSHVGHRPRAYS